MTSPPRRPRTGRDPRSSFDNWVPTYRVQELRDRRGVRAPAARALRRGAAPARVLRARLAQRPHHRSRARHRPGRHGLRHGRRRDRLRLAHGLYVATQRWVDAVPVEGDVQDPPAVTTRDPQVRRLELRSRPSTAPAARSPATCSASGRCPSTRATCVWSPPTSRPGGAAPRPVESTVSVLAENGGGLARDRPGRRHRPGRAGLRRSLHRGARLRRHVPPSRPVARHRPVGPRASRGARRAAHPRLLRLPAPDRRRTAHGRRAGRDRRRARAGNAGVRVRRVGSGQPRASAPLQPRPGLVAGRVGPPRLPLRRAAKPRGAAVRNLDLGRGDGDLELLERRRRAPGRPAGRRPAAHDRAPRRRVSR